MSLQSHSNIKSICIRFGAWDDIWKRPNTSFSDSPNSPCKLNFKKKNIKYSSAVQTPGFSAPAKKSPAPAKKSPAPASGKITPARQKISSPGKFVKIRNWMEISFYISKWKHSLSFRCYCRCPKEFAAQSMYCRSFAGVEQTPAPARLRQNRPKLRLRCTALKYSLHFLNIGFEFL